MNRRHKDNEKKNFTGIVGNGAAVWGAAGDEWGVAGDEWGAGGGEPSA